MVNVRVPDFEFSEIEDDGSDIDWDNITDAQMEAWFNRDAPEIKRIKQLYPNYAIDFLNYQNQDIENLKPLLNYIEFGFEVDMDTLEKTTDTSGIIKFSTGNFPFGGLNRFFLHLNAFDLTPVECFNGFAVIKLKWLSDHEYESIESEEETKTYLQK